MITKIKQMIKKKKIVTTIILLPPLTGGGIKRCFCLTSDVDLADV